MWYLCASVLCLQLGTGDANVSGALVASELTQPQFTSWQEQPPQESGKKPADAPRKKGGQKAGKGKGAHRAPGKKPMIVAPGREQEKISLPTGPMRIELSAIHEARVRHAGEAPKKAATSALRLLARLTGERLGDVVGVGRLVIEELIDDTGAVLAAPEDLTEDDRTATKPVKIVRQVLARGFLSLQAQVKAPSRAARRITKATGWVNVVYGSETEEIMIDNPLQYTGACIKHPRLEELGLKIQVIKPGDEIDKRRDGRGIALQFNGNRKQIRKVEFFDAWMKPMYARERPMRTSDGQEYAFYGVVVGQVDADTQVLLRVYPKIEETRVLFVLENLELP